MTLPDPRPQVTAFRLVLLGLALAAALTFLPLWTPLVVAAWVSVLARPLLKKTARLTGGRHRAAGALVVALVVVLVVPLAAALVSLSRGAIDLGHSIARSDGAKSALIAIVSGGDPGESAATTSILRSPEKLVALVQEHGAQALSLASGIAGAATSVALGLFVFVYAVYVFLVDGPSMYAWAEAHGPLQASQTRRLVAAFNETGRGLFIGVGLTGLAQGVVATVTYVALGVPRALVLGLVTCFASLIPSVGTALVWIPIAIGLALAGKTGSALVMVAVGVLVIGTVDNILRPAFARFGRLELPTFVLLTSIFGGLAMFGTSGLLLGPLFVRLAKEALLMARSERQEEDRAATPATSATSATPAKDALGPSPARDTHAAPEAPPAPESSGR
jgi:predicted PurR-regulated permease PerM